MSKADVHCWIVLGQDGGERAKVLQRKEDERVRKLELEAAEGDERARQWRVVKGEATADDLAVGRAGGHVQMVGRAAVRDAWMTELPPERQPDKKPSQTSKVGLFSHSHPVGGGGGGDSLWSGTVSNWPLLLVTGRLHVIDCSAGIAQGGKDVPVD